MTCPFCGCDPEEEGFEQGACTCQCHWGGNLRRCLASTLTHGSLFSGIGGFDLGFQRAGIETVWQVEIDPFCRRVLEAHFPNARRYRNIKRVRNLAPVDIVSGGFPCQDISSAGRMRGIDGERSGLWSEMWRVVCAVRPCYVVVENVAALLNRGIERVVGNLAESGYDCEWDCLPAIAFGAPHRRDRIFLVAYPQRAEWRSITGAGESGTDGDDGRWRQAPSGFRNGGTDVADSPRLLEGRQIERAIGERTGQRGKSSDLADARGGNGYGRIGNVQVGRIGSAEETTGNGIPRGDEWLVEPDVGRVAHGIPARVDRLKGLGNAIVPQIAEWLGRKILAAEERLAA